jgi:hypothetical protein
LLYGNDRSQNTLFVVLQVEKNDIILHSVFHRILDFKAGLDFYLGPFFYAFSRPRHDPASKLI